MLVLMNCSEAPLDISRCETWCRGYVNNMQLHSNLQTGKLAWALTQFFVSRWRRWHDQKEKEKNWDFPDSSVYSACLLIDFLCNQIFHCSFFFCRNKAKSISKQGTRASSRRRCSRFLFDPPWRKKNKSWMFTSFSLLTKCHLPIVIDIIYHLFIGKTWGRDNSCKLRPLNCRDWQFDISSENAKKLIKAIFLAFS